MSATSSTRSAGETPSPSGARRGAAYAVTAGTVALMLAPLFRSPPTDSFPLSTYPMFSWGRRDARTTVERAVGVDARGARRPIPPRLVGSEEVLQARATIAQSIQRGVGPSRDLCRDIASRVAQHDAFSDIATLEIRTDTFDAVAFLGGRDAAPPGSAPAGVVEARGAPLAGHAGSAQDPLVSKIHATCKVVRR